MVVPLPPYGLAMSLVVRHLHGVVLTLSLSTVADSIGNNRYIFRKAKAPPPVAKKGFNVEAAIKEESRRWAVVQSRLEKRAEAEAAATATAGKQHFATLLSKAGLLPAASMEASTIASPPSVSPLSAKKGFNVEAAIKEEARRWAIVQDWLAKKKRAEAEEERRAIRKELALLAGPVLDASLWAATNFFIEAGLAAKEERRLDAEAAASALAKASSAKFLPPPPPRAPKTKA